MSDTKVSLHHAMGHYSALMKRVDKVRKKLGKKGTRVNRTDVADLFELLSIRDAQIRYGYEPWQVVQSWSIRKAFSEAVKIVGKVVIKHRD
jgi:hypothetical protein